MVNGMLVNDMKTVGKNGLPVVLSHDSDTGKLGFNEIECKNSALKWDLNPVEDKIAGSPIPEGKFIIF